MNKKLTLGIVFCFVQTAMAGETVGKSFYGSEFHEAGQLPYEHCQVRADSSFDVTILGTVGVLAGVSPLSPHDEYSLYCWTGKGDYQFSIPLNMSDLYYGGAIVELTRLGSSTFKISNLTGKTIEDIAGTYSGAGAGFTLLLGGKAGIMSNSKNIHFRYRTTQIGLFGVFVGGTLITLTPYEDVLYTKVNGKMTQLNNIRSFRFIKVDSKGKKAKKVDLEKTSLIE